MQELICYVVDGVILIISIIITVLKTKKPKTYKVILAGVQHLLSSEQFAKLREQTELVKVNGVWRELK